MQAGVEPHAKTDWDHTIILKKEGGQTFQRQQA